jgi:hypothetical protein
MRTAKVPRESLRASAPVFWARSKARATSRNQHLLFAGDHEHGSRRIPLLPLEGQQDSVRFIGLALRLAADAAVSCIAF